MAQKYGTALLSLVFCAWKIQKNFFLPEHRPYFSWQIEWKGKGIRLCHVTAGKEVNSHGETFLPG